MHCRVPWLAGDTHGPTVVGGAIALALLPIPVPHQSRPTPDKDFKGHLTDSVRSLVPPLTLPSNTGRLVGLGGPLLRDR
jgi:hypothetical protein